MFTPRTSALKFSKGPELEAFAWLQSIQPATPFENPIETYSMDEAPASPPPAKNQKPFPSGPIRPTAICPKTGRALFLFLFRDLSCAILREGSENGPAFEVLPAVLALTSEIFDASADNMAWESREGRAPKIRLQAHADGLRWREINGRIGQTRLAEILREAMENAAGRILEADPVADPRAHERMPEGARFAPFSRWPEHPGNRKELARFRRAIQALARMRAGKTGKSFALIRIDRQAPVEPWSQPARRIVAMRDMGGWSGTRDSGLEKFIRQILSDRALDLPDSLSFGPEGSQLLEVRDARPAASAHERLAQAKTVLELLPGIDLSNIA